MEKITITPNMVRGLGDIISPKTLSDFNKQYSKLTTTTDTVHGVTTTIYDLDSTIVFFDAGVTNKSNLSYWYWNTNFGTGTVDENGTTFNATTTSYLTVSTTLTSPSTSNIYIYDFPLTIEFDIVSYEDPTGVTDYTRVRCYNNANTKNAFWNIKEYGVGHYKIVCTEGSQKLYFNGVEQSRSFTFTPTTAWNVAFQTKGNIKYKNFVIY